MLETRRDVLYVPAAGAWSQSGWGTYDAVGRLLVDIAPWDGAAPRGGSWTAPPGAAAAATDADPATVFVYGGLLQSGPALFLETLSRFWGRATSRAAGLRLLFHAHESLDTIWADPRVAAAFATFGISAADCVVPATPLRIARLVAPAPSILPGQLAHRAFARTMATIGLRLAPDGTAPSPRPLHLSHAREERPAFAGESAFDAVLEARGFDVVHPAEISMAAVLRRVRRAAIVTSTRPPTGPAPADVLLALAPGRMRATFGLGSEVGAASRLLDAAAGHDTLDVRPLEPTLAPAECARLFTTLVARRIAASRLACRLEGPADEVDLAIRLDPVAAWCEPGTGTPGAAIGGAFTGRARMRTGWQQRPWWEVDFGTAVALRAVRVHAPVLGIAEEERPAALRLLGSHDGIDWRVLDRRKAAEPIGGLDRAHVFQADAKGPWRFRIFRLQAMHDGVLALDQVEFLEAAHAEAALGDDAAGETGAGHAPDEAAA